MAQANQIEVFERLFSRIGTRVVHEKGTRLPPENIYYLLEGVAALTSLTSDGSENSFLFFRPGMLLNFLPSVVASTGLATDITRKRALHIKHTIYTKTRCTFICMDANAFLHFLESNPVQYPILVQGLCENLINVLALSTDIASKSASVRVCQVILDFMTEETPPVMPRFLTYNELAFYLSLHEVTIKKIFKALMQEDILMKRGQTSVILNVEKLRAIAAEEMELVY